MKQIRNRVNYVIKSIVLWLHFALKKKFSQLITIDFRKHFERLKNGVVKTSTDSTAKFLDLFSGTYYGIRLLKPGATLLAYLSFILILFVVFPYIPDGVFDHLSYINFTEQNTAIVTIMLTVLLSAGFVFLGDDTKGWSLARITIIRDVVKLRGLIVAVLLICGFSILPDITLSGHTLKELLSPLLVATYLFIIGIFIRVYRWLSDLAADPRLFDNDSNDESRIFPSSSYRFARIVYLIRHNNRRDVWQSILERKIPEGYEEFIHQEFFRAADEMIKSRKTEKLQELSFMLEIYDKYYKIRNLNNWRFEVEYLDKFLGLYTQVHSILNVDRPNDIKLAVLWQGQSALERVISEQTQSLMNGMQVYSLFEAMNNYIDMANLAHPKKQRQGNSKVLSTFINSLLDSLYSKESLEAYDVDSWVANKENWQITYENIFEKQNNVTFTLLEHFEEWLFAKLDRYEQKATEKREYMLAVDDIIRLLFPDVDPIEFAQLYWFKYHAKNTTDPRLIVKLISESDRPFGHIGRTDIELAGGDREDALKRFRELQESQRIAGIKLFAHTSASYFKSGFWGIDAIVKEAKKIIKDKTKKEVEIGRLSNLVEDLGVIKKELDL